MSRLGTDNHARSRVPEEELVGSWHLTSVIVAMAISLPAFLVGANIFLSLGAGRGLLAVVAGCVILTGLAMLTMSIGAAARTNTYTIIQLVFGQTGGRFVTSILSATVFGWYGVTATLFGRICVEAVSDTIGNGPGEAIYVVVGSFLMIVTAVFGFRALDLLGRWTVPLMLLVLVASAYLILSPVGLPSVFATPPVANESIKSIGAAASMVVGSLMVAVTIAPDISRFSSSGREARRAAFNSYAVGVVLVLVFAGLPALVTGSNSLIENMSNSGLGLFALGILVLATWTTNATNLYSASLGMSQWFVVAPDWVVTVVAGIIGTILALAGILEHFVAFLLFLSIAIPPVAGVYITEYYAIAPYRALVFDDSDAEATWQPVAFFSWFLGVALGAAAPYLLDVTITGIPAFDATLVTSVSYWIARRRQQGKPTRF